MVEAISMILRQSFKGGLHADFNGPGTVEVEL